MASLVNKYKALPQKSRNYIQLGAFATALTGFLYRRRIMEVVDPARKSARQTAHDAAADASKRA
ncbi:hypothetical protein BGZ58_008509 [Dissophora ornata]|nr:hypothetical protein BGZ58_008509 [Dissophora ornata]